MILIIIYLLIPFKNTIIICNNFTTIKCIFNDEIFHHQKSYFSSPMTFDDEICFQETKSYPVVKSPGDEKFLRQKVGVSIWVSVSDSCRVEVGVFD